MTIISQTKINYEDFLEKIFKTMKQIIPDKLKNEIKL